MPTGKRRGSIGQADITEGMRAILVDWLVEVQESFELNHETLYTAVKLMDLYLSKVLIANIKYLEFKETYLNYSRFEYCCASYSIFIHGTSQVFVTKEELQLVGATACLIACKIDERIPPNLDDFV